MPKKKDEKRKVHWPWTRVQTCTHAWQRIALPSSNLFTKHRWLHAPTTTAAASIAAAIAMQSLSSNDANRSKSCKGGRWRQFKSTQLRRFQPRSCRSSCQDQIYILKKMTRWWLWKLIILNSCFFLKYRRKVKRNRRTLSLKFCNYS